jgi:hypothetical protein
VKYANLGDLQRTYLSARNEAFRDALRGYLFDSMPATAAVYAAVSASLFVSGQIDKTGFEAAWLSTATETDRAILFSGVLTKGGES